MNNKKAIYANRISFIFFELYILTYILLPILTHDIKYLIFLLIPLIFSISLIINLMLKYDKLSSNKMNNISKISVFMNMLLNGVNIDAVSGSLYVGEINWDMKKQQIKKYPSIEPVWVFIIMFCTIFVNFVSIFFIKDINLNLFLIFSIISLIFLLLCQISSSFLLYYDNGKSELLKFWKSIILFILIIVIVICITFLLLFI